jgi:hypothetical protein
MMVSSDMNFGFRCAKTRLSRSERRLSLRLR